MLEDVDVNFISVSVVYLTMLICNELWKSYELSAGRGASSYDKIIIMTSLLEGDVVYHHGFTKVRFNF